MIEIQDLHKVYTMGDVRVNALNGISFRIGKGEFVGVVGPSGSGKSTLLHVIGLLDPPTSGSIRIGGDDVLSLTDNEKTLFRLTRMGYIFQDYALVPELSAIENVALTSLARGISQGETEKKAGKILERMGMGPRIRHLPRELSGGEQQRIAIARALINDPEILLADEPCANLDTTNSKIILDLFKAINQQTGQTILMVSHEEWHFPYFSRIIRLTDGKIIRDTANEPAHGPTESSVTGDGRTFP